MLAGIDVGSTGLKLALFSETGQRLGYAYREYEIQYGQNGLAVLNPEIWWNSLQSCARELSTTIGLFQIQAIGISSANALILTDKHNVPVFPAIMQLDKRGSEMVEQINREMGAERLFRRTGNRNLPGYQWGPALKWFQLHHPEDLERVRHIFNPTSYLTFRLTGSYSMDLTRAVTTSLCDADKRQWDKELWKYFGLTDCERPLIASCEEIVGHSLDGGVFPKNIPVVAGGIDTICAMLGLTGGTSCDVLIIGSVGRFAARVAQWDSCCLNTFSYDGKEKISMTPVNNAGTAMKWVKNLLFSSVDKPTETYEEMNRLAEQALPGSEGLVFLPYLNGASCPRWSEIVRGTVLGLEAYHRPAHMIRAVMEGVAFALGEAKMVLEQCGCDISNSLYLGGGGAKSIIWAQIISDVLGRELLLPEQLETETMGAALLAGMATGCVALEHRKNWNPVQTKVSPQVEHQQIYTALQKKFSEIHGPLKQCYVTCNM